MGLNWHIYSITGHYGGLRSPVSVSQKGILLESPYGGSMGIFSMGYIYIPDWEANQ